MRPQPAAVGSLLSSLDNPLPAEYLGQSPGHHICTDLQVIVITSLNYKAIDYVHDSMGRTADAP